MRTKLLGALALVLLVLHTASARGQFARPIPIPRPVSVPHFFPHSGGSSHDLDWGTIATIAGAVVAVAFGIYWFKNRSSSVRIRIIATPPGEAPEEVRRAWVGLEVPLAAGEREPRTLSAAGVITGENVGVRQGYVVNGKTAIKLLAVHDTHAAEWWRQNARHVAAGGYRFIFPTNVCEKVG